MASLSGRSTAKPGGQNALTTGHQPSVREPKIPQSPRRPTLGRTAITLLAAPGRVCHADPFKWSPTCTFTYKQQAYGEGSAWERGQGWGPSPHHATTPPGAAASPPPAPPAVRKWKVHFQHTSIEASRTGPDRGGGLAPPSTGLSQFPGPAIWTAQNRATAAFERLEVKAHLLISSSVKWLVSGALAVRRETVAMRQKSRWPQPGTQLQIVFGSGRGAAGVRWCVRLVYL